MEERRVIKTTGNNQSQVDIDNQSGTIFDIRTHGHVANVSFWYPRVEGKHKISALQVGLVDVRASDDIQISYDFERDGWKIEQEYCCEDSNNCSVEMCPCCNADLEHPGWKEVAFIQAWGTPYKP